MAVLEGDGLELWFQQNHIPEKARSLISAIRSSGPSRRVGGGTSNVCGRYPSKKMGMSRLVRKPPRRTGRHLRDGAQRFGPGILRSDSAD